MTACSSWGLQSSESSDDNDVLNMNNLNLGSLSIDQLPKISKAGAGSSIKYLYIRGNMFNELWDMRLTANLQVHRKRFHLDLFLFNDRF
jgi:hypothetical protein